ncbi:MAG TPA: hypothetical protein VMR62_01350 [Bryobacteraceae bacterium]|nr:hypothetical protein [Bryobacteraceae bacterium]
MFRFKPVLIRLAAALPAPVRCQPLDAYRIASGIEPHACNADTRVTPAGDQP